ncbi:MAG: hypothetical protein WC081_02430 [Candidatus Ratteibacteria bacterium]|jgi:hypothetical protein
MNNKKGGTLYSPKLSEELVRNLYKIAQAKGISMTKLVNNIVADAIRNVRVEVRMVCETAQDSKEVYIIADNDSFPEQTEV